jgi:signal transduction histidine kinase
MGEVDFVDGALSHPLALAFEAVEAPLVLCASNGSVQMATGVAVALFRRVLVDERPGRVPSDLWRLLEQAPAGEAVEWRPPGAVRNVLGCTRYSAARDSYLLLMREVSAKNVALSQRVQRERLASTERLIASIAHDIRSSVASVVYCSDFLLSAGATISPAVLAETLRDISTASASLQRTVDSLLDYANLGPNVCLPVSLREVIGRAFGSLRSHYGEGVLRLRVDVAPQSDWVLGNPIIIEQIFANLLLNAVEASLGQSCVIVTAFPATAAAGSGEERSSYVCIRVWDDGPGIPTDLRQHVFDPFFSTKQQSAGLGLAVARRAAEDMNGRLELAEGDGGTCFAVYLPASEAPR